MLIVNTHKLVFNLILNKFLETIEDWTKNLSHLFFLQHCYFLAELEWAYS